MPDATMDQIERLKRGYATLTKEQQDLLGDPNVGWIFMNLNKFEIIDLKDCIMYSYDGKHIEVKPYNP
jgi:hypothetical protein